MSGRKHSTICLFERKVRVRKLIEAGVIQSAEEKPGDAILAVPRSELKSA